VSDEMHGMPRPIEQEVMQVRPCRLRGPVHFDSALADRVGAENLCYLAGCSADRSARRLPGMG
jgi:hypothetical protein